MNCNPALHTNCEVLKEVIPSAVVETLGELKLLPADHIYTDMKTSHVFFFQFSRCLKSKFEATLKPKISHCMYGTVKVPFIKYAALLIWLLNGLMCDTTQHVVFICCPSFMLFSRFNSWDLQQVSSQAEDSSFGQSEGVCAVVQRLSSWFSAGLQQEQHKQWILPEKHQKDPKDWTQKMQVRDWGQNCALSIPW